MEMSKERPKKIKKPFHLKKADLDLDGYRKDIQDRSPALLFDRALNTLKISRQFHLYVALQLLTAYLGFGQVILCIGILWMMVVNTGKRKPGEKSAYSLFNDNVEAIDGATNIDYLEREMRRQLY